MQSARQHLGFTLIELVLVLALLAVLMAMVAPSVRGFGRGQRVENAADAVLAATVWSRTEAITTTTPHRLQFEPDGTSFTVTTQVGGLYEPARGRLGILQRLPETVTVICLGPDGTSMDAFDFYPTGRVTPGTVTVENEQGDVITLQAVGAADPWRRVEVEATP